MIYIIDSSSLIDLFHIYPVNIFESLYTKFESEIASGNILSPIQVKYELDKQDDEVKAWIKGKKIFRETDGDIFDLSTKISNKYPNILRGKTGIVVDPYIIALAHSINGINNVKIITGESKKKGHLPAVARECCNIDSVNLLEFFQEKEWKF
ncbi:DUF4411 family protein [Ferroplasma sp.]|uniref:DUF4411 family protein n=1 Tax=Ferroplasma sp. TaxID=2591003 RepID=UPI00307D3598